MKQRELIELFRERADQLGKRLTIEPVRRGTKLKCGERCVVLPRTKNDLKHVRAFEHRLGLF